MKTNNSIYFLASLLVLSVLLMSCQSVPESVPEGLSQQEFFQIAQEYTDDLNYDAALFYLEEFKVRFPEDRYNHLAADYQIALIHYKQELYGQAEEEFQAIVDTYNSASDGTYPEWVQVLSEKLLEKIRNLD